MATGDKLAQLFTDCLLSKQVVADWLFDYLSNKIDETISGILQGKSGTLDTQVIGLAADGNDMFKLDLTNASRVAVTGGQVIDLAQEDIDYHTKKIQFENANTVVYEVGVRYASIPDTLDLDPRKGIPKYIANIETFGEKGNPDSITDTFGSQIKVIIDSLTEAGVSNAGRQAKIWLTTPLSAVLSVAFYEATVQWDGSNNYIVVPYSGSNGPLGQDTTTDPPSTTPADYEVLVYGPRVVRNITLQTNPTYAFIGTVTGVGAGSPPSVFNTSNQFSVFLITRQAAYDGIGAGAGRVITVANGALEKRQYPTTSLRPDTNYAEVWKGIDGVEWLRVEPFGRIAVSSRFKDDFYYNPASWNTAANAPAHKYIATVTGTGNVRMMQDNSSHASDAVGLSGVVELYSDTTLADKVELEGPAAMRIKGRRPGGYFRFAHRGSIADQTTYLLLRNGYTGGPRQDGFGFKIVNNLIYGVAIDSAGAETLSAALATLITDIAHDLYFLVTGPTALDVWATGMSTPVGLTLPFSVDTLNAEHGRYWKPYASVETTAGGGSVKIMQLDFWECWLRGYIPAA